MDLTDTGQRIELIDRCPRATRAATNGHAGDAALITRQLGCGFGERLLLPEPLGFELDTSRFV